MNSYSDESLTVMLTELESDRVERKESFKGNAPQTAREAVCAFANDLAGHGKPGVVFLGVRDDGSPVEDFTVTDELLRQLADIKTDGNIAPPPTLLVERRHLCGHDIAVITAWPCDTPPVRFKGRIHVRWGPRRGLATAQDERILNERRRHRDRPYDVQPVRDAVLDEIDRLRFEQEYLPALVAHDVLAANERSYEQKLAATKMVLSDTDPAPTVLGLLIIGKSPSDWIPGAYTQFLRLAGTDLTAPILDEEVIHGTVADQIRRLEEKLEAHNLRGVRFADVATEERRETYPLDALRALGYVQRFGAGIAIARKALGERLGFEVQPGFVAAIIQGETA
ncbi:MAG: putative DNA binding domain-containing protein [Candidatus Nitricoxidivorans perseverans]|uniref:DNA binding domain-containing protein n=1 Tax=Candidatus Nitricoxidivorans perseverans TaxID=2975601 RepID=A0AA49FME5_9PROT|nr:MAG: putative DNA binding domain-containing protein [Candidatus Nitricoxidivorans perseverans]